MFIVFLGRWLCRGIIIMAIFDLIIILKSLKMEKNKDFLMVRFILGIAMLCSEIELCILSILQGNIIGCRIFFIGACIFLPSVIMQGIGLKNNNQQNKK